MSEDPGKDDKFEFTPEGESIEYISLGDARVKAISHARENTEIYGPDYQDTSLVWESVSEEEREEFYDIKLSFRPAGSFTGTPGLEQFVISKTGTMQVRQAFELPIPEKTRTNVGSVSRGNGATDYKKHLAHS